MKAHSAETNLIEYEYTNNLCATISHRIELCSEAGSQERSDSEIGYDLSALTDLKTLHMSRDMIEKCYINVHAEVLYKCPSRHTCEASKSSRINVGRRGQVGNRNFSSSGCSSYEML